MYTHLMQYTRRRHRYVCVCVYVSMCVYVCVCVYGCVCVSCPQPPMLTRYV